MSQSFPGGASGKERACQCRRRRRRRRWGFSPWMGKIPCRGGMATHSSILAWRIPWTGTWQATVYRVAQSQTDWSNLACTHADKSQLGLSSVLKGSRLLGLLVTFLCTFGGTVILIRPFWLWEFKYALKQRKCIS